MYKVGAEAYAKQVGLPLDVLTTEANSQKGLTDIKAEVARTGANVAFYIDPNDRADCENARSRRRLLCNLVEQTGRREGLGLSALDCAYLV